MPCSYNAELHYDGSEPDIQIFSTHEAVRERPGMYIGSTASEASYKLLQLAVEGLLWHYRYLGMTPSQITIRLETDGSATVVSTVEALSPSVLQHSLRLLRKEVSRLVVEEAQAFRHVRGDGAMSELFVVTALSAHLNVSIHEEPHRWRSLQFEQGVLSREEKLPDQADNDFDIQLRLWPDFTILDPVVFDPEQVRQTMHALSKDFPTVPLLLIDARS